MGASTPFTVHCGVVAPLMRSHIDTDQIVPRPFLKRLERSGFGEFLFHDWRKGADGAPNPEFVLNQPEYAGASVLVTGRNFGCGSSREHAAWALADYGFRVIIATSFADIFFANTVVNGLLAATVPAEVAAAIADRATRFAPYRLVVDLEACEVRDGAGLKKPFRIDKVSRARLMDGRDEIDRILEHEASIAAYEARRLYDVRALVPHV
jgi:3-isopropylmalate/(R)-2-methylmalate dehydratase small subunit